VTVTGSTEIILFYAALSAIMRV